MAFFNDDEFHLELLQALEPWRKQRHYLLVPGTEFASEEDAVSYAAKAYEAIGKFVCLPRVVDTFGQVDVIPSPQSKMEKENKSGFLVFSRKPKDILLLATLQFDTFNLEYTTSSIELLVVIEKALRG